VTARATTERSHPINTPPKTKKLLTPLYIKADPEQPWPADRTFYILAGTGLYLCRNHELFTSCVPARSWPAELAEQATFLKTRYPKVPRRLMESAVGFFDAVYECHRAEAAVVILWDGQRKSMRLEAPQQTSTVGRNWYGEAYPVDVHYELPTDLPPDCHVLGDIHSHCDYAAYASYVDKTDETHRPGLHMVVGRIRQEPPEFHAEIVVDGTRFRVRTELVIEDYRQRRMDFPSQWMDRVKVEARQSSYGYSYGYSRNEDDDPEKVADHGDRQAGEGASGSPAPVSTDTGEAPRRADAPLGEDTQRTHDLTEGETSNRSEEGDGERENLSR